MPWQSHHRRIRAIAAPVRASVRSRVAATTVHWRVDQVARARVPTRCWPVVARRSEEHTSELQSLMRISYAVFCLQKKKNKYQRTRHQTHVSIILTTTNNP